MLDADALINLLEGQFTDASKRFAVEAADPKGVVLRMRFSESMLRPGQAISGPAMMSLADTAIYLAVLARLGPIETYTSDLHIRFLRRAPPGDIRARARLLKVGSRLASAVVDIEDHEGLLVAHVTASYSLPPK